MKKHLLTLTVIGLVFTSCQSEGEKALAAYRAKLSTDSLLVALESDTTGLSTSPIKITEAKLVPASNDDKKDISLSYKNISSKTIAGVRLKWKGTTAFDEPARMGFIRDDGFGTGEAEVKLNPGESITQVWEISSNNAKKVSLSWPTEVIFSDGTKWKIGVMNYYKEK